MHRRPDIEKARAALAAFLAALAACDASAPEPRKASESPIPQHVAADPAPSVLPSPPAPVHPTPPSSLAFAHWMVSNCHLDTLAPSAYTIAWFRYARPTDLLGPGDPKPDEALAKLPEMGSKDALEQARAVERDWLQHPQSHVVDCSFLIEPRTCPDCRLGSVQRAHYVAYLPKLLFEQPERVHSMLLLIPGGNGGRTRPFMRPIPGHLVYDRGSGGLDTKRLADAFHTEHPELGASLIVALETSGGAYQNGPAEHLAHDLPGHLRSVFLSHLGERKAWLGAEGVSSGAGELYRAAMKHPDAFHTLGFSCMSCSGIDPRKGWLGGEASFQRFAEALSQRRKQGEFELRLAVGELDGQFKCNRALYRGFVATGAAADAHEEPQAFQVYPGEKHDFEFLRHSYRDSLYWHLSHLGHKPNSKRPKSDEPIGHAKGLP